MGASCARQDAGDVIERAQTHALVSALATPIAGECPGPRAQKLLRAFGSLKAPVMRETIERAFARDVVDARASRCVTAFIALCDWPRAKAPRLRAVLEAASDASDDGYWLPATLDDAVAMSLGECDVDLDRMSAHEARAFFVYAVTQFDVGRGGMNCTFEAFLEYFKEDDGRDVGGDLGDAYALYDAVTSAGELAWQYLTLFDRRSGGYDEEEMKWIPRPAKGSEQRSGGAAARSSPRALDRPLRAVDAETKRIPLSVRGGEEPRGIAAARVSLFAHDAEMITLAIRAARLNRPKDIEKLVVEKGFHVDARDEINKRQTLFIIAAANGNKSTCKKLLTLGADPCARDDSGRTAVDVANAYNHFALAEYLISHGVPTGADMDADTRQYSRADEQEYSRASQDDENDADGRSLDDTAASAPPASTEPSAPSASIEPSAPPASNEPIESTASPEPSVPPAPDKTVFRQFSADGESELLTPE